MTNIRNYMETVVEHYLDEMLRTETEQNRAVRENDGLRAAVMAQTLNNIPPFYVTGKVGEVYGFSAGAEVQNKADIVAEIAKAIEVLTANGYNQ